MGPERREALLAEYREVCQNFRLLTDIRFRLLALVPAAAAIIAVVGDDKASTDRLPVALLGLGATLGIATYNKRNDQLYDELVGRAAAIERSLGLQDGGFTTRPNPWLRYRVLGITWEVNHRLGVGTIYFATAVLWFYLVLAPVLVGFMGTEVWELVRDWFSENLSPSLASWFSKDVASRVVAAAFAVLLVWLGVSTVQRQERRRKDQLRRDSIAALEMLNRCEREVRRETLVPVPSSRSDLKRSLGQNILESLAEDRPFLDACARLLGSADEVRVDKVRARVWFYSGIHPDTFGHYVPDTRGVWRNAFLLALLVDLPPLWLADVWANRRGTTPTDCRGRPEFTPEDQ